jgi:hypothetical protein
MSSLDRFLLTPAGADALADRSVFQLASMATLYTAVKINEPQAMDPKFVSMMSRGICTPEQIEAMESTILCALEFRVNPPTTTAFLRAFLNLIPKATLSRTMQETVFSIAKTQTELAVADFSFVSTKASTIAYCAFMNALESINVVDSKSLGFIGFILSQSIGISHCNNQVIVTVQERLYESILGQQLSLSSPVTVEEQQSCTEQQSPKQIKQRRTSLEQSPRTISEHLR